MFAPKPKNFPLQLFFNSTRKQNNQAHNLDDIMFDLAWNTDNQHTINSSESVPSSIHMKLFISLYKGSSFGTRTPSEVTNLQYRETTKNSLLLLSKIPASTFIMFGWDITASFRTISCQTRRRCSPYQQPELLLTSKTSRKVASSNT